MKNNFQLQKKFFFKPCSTTNAIYATNDNDDDDYNENKTQKIQHVMNSKYTTFIQRHI